MFKTDSLKRYEDYLNEMIEVALLGELQTPDLYRTKYGVSAAFFSFLKKQGVFYQTESGLWKTNRKDTFTTEEVSMLEVSMLKNVYNRHKKYQLRTTGKLEENPPVRDLQNNSKLAEFSTKELLAELKKRGYSGEIFISKSVKF